MMTTGSSNPVQKNSPNTLAPSILMMHHSLSLSWPQPSDRPETTLLKQKTPIFTRIREVRESPNSDTPGRKAGAIFVPANSGLSPPLPPFEVRARECFLWVKNKVSSMYLHSFHVEIMKLSPFLLHHT